MQYGSSDPEVSSPSSSSLVDVSTSPVPCSTRRLAKSAADATSDPAEFCPPFNVSSASVVDSEVVVDESDVVVDAVDESDVACKQTKPTHVGNEET